MGEALLRYADLPTHQKVRALVAADQRLLRENKYRTLFASLEVRAGYRKHLEFFAAGQEHRERLFLAGNRVGKTVVGAYELTLHLTGLYPRWWTGRRFDRQIDAIAAGKTVETTRDIVQHELLGAVGQSGTGMIPKHLLRKITPAQGIPDAVKDIQIKHISGYLSNLSLKTYKAGRDSFEGTTRHVVWFDEEPPLDVYTEALMRTMTTQGLIMCTFTPLLGISDVVKEFLPGGRLP
jgi:phage terminase large subunit-like protein